MGVGGRLHFHLQFFRSFQTNFEGNEFDCMVSTYFICLLWNVVLHYKTFMAFGCIFINPACRICIYMRGNNNPQEANKVPYVYKS